MKTFEKLAERIEKDTGLKLHKFRRTYAGFHQRSNGNWSWGAYEINNECNDIGSQYSASKLLKSKKPLLVNYPGWPYSNEIIFHDIVIKLKSR